MKEIKFIDLFGGIGGFRLGLERCNERQNEEEGFRLRLEKSSCNSERWRKKRIQTNTKEEHDVSPENTTSPLFRCVGYYEIDKYCVQVYNYNFKENHKPTDITAVKASDIPDHDLLCGGFPCKDFSIAGKRKGFQGTNGTMFFEICRILKEKRPRLCLLENVRGLLSADDGRVFHTILLSLDELGYDAEWQIFNTIYHLPQNRERVFIIGHLREDGGCSREVFPIREGNSVSGEGGETGLVEDKFATAITKNYHKGVHSRGETYIQEKPKMIHNVYGEFNEGVREFEDYSPTIRTPKSGGHLPLVMEHKKITDRSREYGDGFKEGNSFCLDSGCGRDLIIHPQIRRLMPIECEKLQGFPDNWTARGVDEWGEEVIISDSQRYKQLGNAVTVNVIEVIGENIMHRINEE